ncbi:hypothetical protein [Hyalangium versicolor]|uniref:hypothetical protein n=1 Tax=Hyalangium versicolor TaxID=2861190 RepID=UPI001CCCCB50|nr:hypothetical protein [Hyalangium versicolor]
MGRDCTASLVDDLRASAPTEHSRWLTELEEPAFRELLHARYGDTYSYPMLYEPGGASRLWRSGRLLSLGELNAQGAVVSHTGLWTAPGRDSVDSGLSLTHPSQRTAMDRDEHTRMWRHLLGRLRTHVGFVHQNTSTLHLMAQRYASRIMGAVPVGLVVNYTQGEQLIGVEGSGIPMQALAMTTVLSPLPPRTRYLPSGHWGEWLLSILAGLDVSKTAVLVPTEGGAHTKRYILRPIDWNESLLIERRELTGLSDSEAGEPELRSPRARVDLVHLSMGDPQQVAVGTPVLLAAGYRPSGVRLHRDSPDEIVFQHVRDVSAACVALSRARLAGRDSQALFAGWVERCARTS